jgi:hygromycin-B 4-O-kinase
MSTLKTQTAQDEVVSFLKHQLSLDVRDLQPIRGGEISQAYEVKLAHSELIFRVGPSLNNFIKDKLAQESYSSSLVPIPMVLEAGPYKDQLAFALSEKIQGVRVDKLSAEELRAALPGIAQTLVALHSAPIQSGTGFGYWNWDSEPASKSWSEFLISSMAAQLPQGIDLTAAAQIAAWYKRFLQLCPQLPASRCLVHGDFGFDNTFVKGIKVSGVIDWAESMFGDPLYDLAWLTFWSGEKAYLDAYLATPEGRRFGEDSVDKRMTCYFLRIGLRAMSHYERSGQIKSVEWAMERTQRMSG